MCCTMWMVFRVSVVMLGMFRVCLKLFRYEVGEFCNVDVCWEEDGGWWVLRYFQMVLQGFDQSTCFEGFLQVLEGLGSRPAKSARSTGRAEQATSQLLL